VDETSSGSCSVAGCGISDIEFYYYSVSQSVNQLSHVYYFFFNTNVDYRTIEEDKSDEWCLYNNSTTCLPTIEP